MEFYFKNLNKNFEHINKPDLQNELNNIGVEVVQAKTEQDGKFNSLCREIFKQKMNKEEALKKANKMFKNKFHGLIISANSTLGILQTRGLYSPQKKLDLITEKLQEKLEKLKQYKLFKLNALYIFYNDIEPNNNDIENLVQKFIKIQNCFLLNFDLIFINCLNFIYIIDKNENYKVIKHYYSDKEPSEFKIKALEYERTLVK